MMEATHSQFKPRWVYWVNNPTYVKAKGRRTRAMEAPNGKLYRLPDRVLYDPRYGEKIWTEIQAGQWNHVELACLDWPDQPDARWAYAPVMERLANVMKNHRPH